MTMFNYPSDFDFAYKGYQYPLPPSWKYAIRLEDQIQWLLQAILLINDDAVSQAMLESGLASTLDEAKQFAEQLTNALKADMDAKLSDIDERVNALKAGISQWVSPVVDGNVRYAPYVDKQLFNVARPYCVSNYELVEHYEGMTYGEVRDELYNYNCYQLAVYAGCIIGLMTFGNYNEVLERCKPYSIDDTIYAPVYPTVIRTWQELKNYGALTYERSND